MSALYVSIGARTKGLCHILIQKNAQHKAPVYVGVVRTDTVQSSHSRVAFNTSLSLSCQTQANFRVLDRGTVPN